MRRIVTGSAALLASLLSLTGIVAIASPASAATGDLVINEVESNGDTQDWVELYNPTAEAIDASGLRLKDDDDSRTFAIASGTTVAAGGYVAIDVDAGTGNFGLGAADKIRLFQADGTTPIDSYEWATHAATTYGTCTPGSNAFYVTTASTKGAANNCTVDLTAKLVLNEIESNPNPDWIELKNIGTVPVDASGIVVKDSTENDPFTIPSGTIVEPNAYLVLDALGSLGLGGADSVRLFANASATTAFQSYSWGPSHATQTFGRCADGIGAFVDTAGATKGATNNCALPAETANIKINEVQSDPADIIELTNIGATDVNVAGWYVKDSQELNAITGANLVVPAGGFLRLDGNTNFQFGLGKGDQVHLIYADGVTELDSTTWAADTHVTSWGRCPDGTGAFQVLGSATFGAANACGTDFTKLKINEIESEGDPSDWVELTNTGTVAVDATGLILKDSTEGNNITIPSSAPIAPGGFLAVDVTGLGNGDSARLFNGATLLDSYAYPGHADETWGRCPDGLGDFQDTDAATKGAANDCAAPVGYQNIKVNEVESSGGTPVDWIEFTNTGDTAVNLSQWVVKDNDDSHSVKFPANTTIAAHGFITIDTDVTGGFGLGNEDSARLFLPDGTTLVDSQSWGPAHATVTFGLCPDGAGSLKQTFTSTKGAPNDCSPIRINEVESSGGTPVDWVELINAGSAPVDTTGYVLKDSDDSHSLTVPATTLAVGQILTVDVDVTGGFGLGGADSIRLFDVGGTALLDSYTWTEHAATTYGRCPNGTGAFALTVDSTKGGANSCEGTVVAEAWPGPAPVTTVDTASFFGEDMSGLAYEGTGTDTRGTLWGVRNGDGTLFKLTWDGAQWVAPAGEWAAGKALRYPDGNGVPDSEGIGFGGTTPADGVYVATERNGDASGVSRPSILRYDVSAAGPSLTATNEWNLTGLIPPVGNNTGAEGIAFVPDSFLTAQGFLDESTSQAYDPADYANHGTGLFFVGVEATGGVYAFALSSDNTAHLVATLATGLTVAAEVTFEPTTGQLWAACDDACQGKIAVFEIAQSGLFDGKFRITHVYENPVGMLDTIANEGLAFADQGLCVDDVKPVWYADDSATDGHSLREASIACVSDEVPTEPVPPTEEQLTPESKNQVTGPASAKPGDTITITVGDEFAGGEFSAWIFSDPVLMGTQVVTGAGTISATIPLSTPAGAHRIAVTDNEGNLIGWFDIAITATGLPVTGGELGPVLPIALLVLVLGGVLLVGATRLRTVRRV